MKCNRFRSFAALTLTALLAQSVVAIAAEKDKEAQKALDQAMNDDYLATEFGKAEKRLKDMLKKCGKDGCSPAMVGKLNVALGTIYVNMQPKKLSEAKDAFAMALQADPNASFDPALKSKELEDAFKAAQAVAKAAEPPAKKPSKEDAQPKDDQDDGNGDAAPEPPPKKSGKPKRAESDESSSGGDINAKPSITEQAVNTPVPIYIEFPEDVGAEKATLKYKPFGSKQFKTIEMKKLGDGYAAEIPCEDVTTTGDLKYYIVAKDGQGDSAGTAGSASAPLKISIKNEIDGDAPSLPGKKAPSQCKAKEDCPPGLPGCPDGRSQGRHGEKGWGATCDASEECQSGFVCLNGLCEEGKGGDEGSSGKTGGKHMMASLSVGFEPMAMSGADNVCTAASDTNHYCFYSTVPKSLASYNNPQFYGKPANTGSSTNALSGGLSFADVRVLAAFDYFLDSKKPFSFGARLGWKFGGMPVPDNTRPDKKGLPTEAPSFAAFHGEARAAWHPMGAMVEQKKFQPYVFAAAGLANASASVPVSVCDTVDTSGNALAATDTKGTCKGKGHLTNLDAYQLAGLGFIGGFIGFGGGATYGITPTFGLMAELKFMVLLPSPTNGFVISPSLGPVFAF